ncbi:hypothetical protein L249_4914, partial [Ophiocordyceps polyrhachis-furcata BCC 54312]
MWHRAFIRREDIQSVLTRIAYPNREGWELSILQSLALTDMSGFQDHGAITTSNGQGSALPLLRDTDEHDSIGDVVLGLCSGGYYQVSLRVVASHNRCQIETDARGHLFEQRSGQWLADSHLGTLLTFLQFLFVAITSYVAQFDSTRPPLYLTPAKVPFRHWVVNIVLFFSINVLNNHAFSYSISVPLHIILRSGGSITTMLADQVDSERPTSNVGLLILFVAQLLSAALGLHTETIYEQYGPQWRENLFYSHLLSLPLFLPFVPSMARVLGRMTTSERMAIPAPFLAADVAGIPIQLAYLATNVITQFACIRGVNLIAANASALTVTIVLSVRKLVSLIVSIWLFGNTLPKGTLMGAVIVFSSGALYSMDSRPKQVKTTDTKDDQALGPIKSMATSIINGQSSSAPDSINRYELNAVIHEGVALDITRLPLILLRLSDSLATLRNKSKMTVRIPKSSKKDHSSGRKHCPMASIFTYDPDPPRVSSPWLAADEDKDQGPGDFLAPKLASEYGLTRLQAEPQRGPTEYKLHLLLRPRRAYTFMSTTRQASLSSHVDLLEKFPLDNVSASSMVSGLLRRERLKHLTTQLLWRLQQSSPYHASSSKEVNLPKLPVYDVTLDAPIKVEPLVPGIRESRGALYELGVSDDGTLVGLTEDEMRESMATLRLMAASLGCVVDVVRLVIVGDCEWTEQTMTPPDDNFCHRQDTHQTARLWVVEAFVTPSLVFHCENDDVLSSATPWTPDMSTNSALPGHGSSTPQLRVTLTGPTTCGKSSLLGTLSTGTLDNGRGKSRLSLLKHRHEIASGVTSSIAQELIGYKDREIINFAKGNIDSWVDIHDCADAGRLVFVSDSGGHPRYRRSALRGLMSWAPHWSILCIAADTNDEVRPDEVGETPTTHELRDLVEAHLTLSLKLDVPMAIVITKLDLASKSSLHMTMTKVLTSIKGAGRVPRILQPDQRQFDGPGHITREDQSKVETVCAGMTKSENLTGEVPILLTSVVNGTGIGLVHALLAALPLPPMPAPWDRISPMETRQPNCLFHINDTFRFPESHTTLAWASKGQTGRSVIVSGHVRYGNLSVGDKVVIGPFRPMAEEACSLELAMREHTSSRRNLLIPQKPAAILPLSSGDPTSAAVEAEEWRKAKVVSIRNLRLPVFVLGAGQAGSVGLVFDPDTRNPELIDDLPRLRRGMVLAALSKQMSDDGLSPRTASRFTAIFCDVGIRSLVERAIVDVYFASAKAVARVIGLSHHEQATPSANPCGAVPTLEARDSDVSHATAHAPHEVNRAEVTLELLHNREWIGLGCTVLLLAAGRQEMFGLQGFVGKCIEVVE